MKLALAAWSHSATRLDENVGLPDLEGALAEHCRERFRRVDRFIALALIGSSACARGAELRAGCGLYVSSSLGPLSSNDQVQDQMVRQGLVPKPFQFVNTLGSAVGFYLARNLELAGPSTFVWRRGGAFLSALALASADLERGAVSQALVGCVDERLLPLATSRAMLGLGADAQVAESSTWMLIEPAPAASRARTLRVLRAGGFAAAFESCGARPVAGDALAFAARAGGTDERRVLAQLTAAPIRDECVDGTSADAMHFGRHLEREERGALFVFGPGGRTLALLAAH
jgi:hypothetical protein